ncbi:MAG: hypothetical protein HY846_06000 [Nitrosomonadales bacterium]|nr:hypothetical protein [Nitrosomonadales bacterium]
MFKLRLIAIVAATCFLAVPAIDWLIPLARAQAFILTPAAEDPDVLDANSPADPVLQLPAEAFLGLPLDRKGAVDWMQALNSGIIAPRTTTRQMVMEEMEILDQDVIMKNTRDMPYVKFPHKPHTRWLSCSNCHNEIFATKTGSSQINMRKIFLGEYCGVCHGKVAFTPTNSCERCHSVPHGSTKAWW